MYNKVRAFMIDYIGSLTKKEQNLDKYGHDSGLDLA